MIEQVYKAKDNDTQRALEHLHSQSVGVNYTTTAPTADEVPAGKVVVYDDGTTRRMYVRTGKGDVGYISLTMI